MTWDRFSKMLFRLTALLIGVLPLAAETLEEARATFEKADSKLNAEWKKLASTLPEWSFKELQEEQRTWRNYRDAAAEEEAIRQGGASEGQEAETPEYWSTRTLITAARVRMLEGFLKQGADDDWSGEWIDGYGGRMNIVQDGKHFFFTIDVVRGPTYHVGSIAGQARINGDHARFTDANNAERPSEDEETWLDFQLSNPRIEVRGINTGWYHGVRAYFDGTYIRVGPLSKEQSSAVRAGKLE